jgi:HlyD family secretion protein
MSIVRMQRQARTDGAVSGSGMDRVVERKRLPLKVKIAAGVGAVLLVAGSFYWFAPRGDSQTVAAGRLTVSDVRSGTFDDFIPLRARVTPLLTVYIDAVEGGRVEEMLVEDGATVAKGQLIAVLSNAELQLSTLARQTEVEQQINNMRSQELSLAQTRLSNERAVLEAELALQKVQRQYERERPLADQGFVSGKQFADTRDELAYQQRRLAAIRRGQATDARLQGSQLSQQRSRCSPALASRAPISRRSICARRSRGSYPASRCRSASRSSAASVSARSTAPAATS